ncbi:cortical protein KAR9-domain-containing protein [Astrocystis sublimbata]|nr:cortical protein KAR9-domain-containing protein [Astrocystis sublimbata]
MTGLSTEPAPSPHPPSHLHPQQHQHHPSRSPPSHASHPGHTEQPSLLHPGPDSDHTPDQKPGYHDDGPRTPDAAERDEPGSTAQSSAPDRHHAAQPLPETILTFSEVPSDLLKLGPPASQPRNGQTTTAAHAGASSDCDLTPPSIRSSAFQRRKPSPGLAARLKALGFGSGTKDGADPLPNPSQSEAIGRLPEDQLRSLDLNHQLKSAGLVVERRGRPWKGAGAPLQHLLRSKSSRDSLRKRGGDAGADDENAKDKDKAASSVQPADSLKPELLPEISQIAPLEMDTHKYILPDHTNGNGTKATPETRREHVNRNSRAVRFDETPPPPPPPKDTPPEATAPAEFPQNLSYFNPLGLQRPGSIYTISRASFTNQLAQLTALQLPNAELLSSKVAAIPTAQAATKALIGAAEQIRSWIAKASEVIEGLDSEDDVEWAAAGGREGYEEVESAITRFEELINVYVTAIEAMQGRDDIASVSNDDLQQAVTQMEMIMTDWTKIRTTLNNAKSQVETAMEWEELWNMVLGDIQNEVDDLKRLVFEMEERRHKSIMAVSGGDGVDIGDLETIVEETPPAVVRNNRYSVPAFPLSPSSPGTPALNQDDTSLLALFARMQPLRASLDFLPMRLSVFEARALSAFPAACEELETRRDGLEASYKKLEKDADSLRKELGEDKWVLVFRGAGRQAQKMVESVDRSMIKLQESIDQGLQFSNPPVMSKKIENYEAKKMHYGPAIDRVLSIIDKGVKDRLTVNGEILRLHTEIRSRWEGLKRQMGDIDGLLEEIQADKRSQQLRDSISSILSNDKSTIGSGHDTPGSSPPSSVIMSNLGLEPVTPVHKSKSRSASTTSSIPQPSSSRRGSSTLAPPSRHLPGSRLSTLSHSSSTMSTPVRSGSTTPFGSRHQKSGSPRVVDYRPRWNTSTNTASLDIGHNFTPLSLTTPSPYKRSPTPVKRTPTPVKRTPTPLRPNSTVITPGSQESKLPLRSPLSRGSSASPAPSGVPLRPTTQSRLSFRERVASTAPSANNPPALAAPKQRLTSKASMGNLNNNNRRSSFHPGGKALGAPLEINPRASSSMATSRRTSLLPLPMTTNSPAPGNGRRSAAGSRMGSTNGDDKPRWRF